MIFVDTSFWIALRNRRDAMHDQARALRDRHGDEPLVTTNHVRGESATFLRRRVGHGAAVDLLDVLERSPRVQVVQVPEPLENEALQWLRRRDEREYSYVDATSFALMRARRMRRALAFDGDFSAAGFEELRSK